MEGTRWEIEQEREREKDDADLRSNSAAMKAEKCLSAALMMCCLLIFCDESYRDCWK